LAALNVKGFDVLLAGAGSGLGTGLLMSMAFPFGSLGGFYIFYARVKLGERVFHIEKPPIHEAKPISDLVKLRHGLTVP